MHSCSHSPGDKICTGQNATDIYVINAVLKDDEQGPDVPPGGVAGTPGMKNQ
jgi:hypothetical protein